MSERMQPKNDMEPIDLAKLMPLLLDIRQRWQNTINFGRSGDWFCDDNRQEIYLRPVDRSWFQQILRIGNLGTVADLEFAAGAHQDIPVLFDIINGLQLENADLWYGRKSLVASKTRGDGAQKAIFADGDGDSGSTDRVGSEGGQKTTAAPSTGDTPGVVPFPEMVPLPAPVLLKLLVGAKTLLSVDAERREHGRGYLVDELRADMESAIDLAQCGLRGVAGMKELAQTLVANLESAVSKLPGDAANAGTPMVSIRAEVHTSMVENSQALAVLFYSKTITTSQILKAFGMAKQFEREKLWMYGINSVADALPEDVAERLKPIPAEIKPTLQTHTLTDTERVIVGSAVRAVDDNLNVTFDLGKPGDLWQWRHKDKLTAYATDKTYRFRVGDMMGERQDDGRVFCYRIVSLADDIPTSPIVAQLETAGYYTDNRVQSVNAEVAESESNTPGNPDKHNSLQPVCFKNGFYLENAGSDPPCDLSPEQALQRMRSGAELHLTRSSFDAGGAVVATNVLKMFLRPGEALPMSDMGSYYLIELTRDGDRK